MLKVVCLQIHASFHEKYEHVLKVKYCEENKESH
jgi:hypothetical protein